MKTSLSQRSIRTTAIAALSFAVLAGSADVAAGGSRATCQAQSGRTLATSPQARLYVTRRPTVLSGRPAKRRPGIYLCGFTRESATPQLLFSGTERPDGYGLTGGYAWARYIENADDTPDADLQAIFYLAGVNRDRVNVAGITGVSLSDIVISKAGVVAALATSQQSPYYLGNGPGEPADLLPPTSSIVAADFNDESSRGVSQFRTIASAPPGTFTHLAATPDSTTLLWSGAGGAVASAPFLVPAGAPARN